MVSEPAPKWKFLTNHAQVLVCIAHDPGVRLREISERVGATAPTAVEQLRNMEKRGLISRRASEEDRRKVHFHLTEMGRSVETELLAYAEGVNRIAMEGFTEGEIGFLRLALLRVQDNLAKAKG